MTSLSVITPNLNQGRYLPTNLTSVASQTYAEVEHIVVDARSTDGSTETLSSYQHDKRFLYLQDSDRGQSDAINKGLLFATGDVVCWLNADDYYSSKDSLERVAKAFNDNPAVDVVYARGEYMNATTSKTTPAWIQAEPEQLKRTLASSVGMIQPSVFFKRSLLARVGYLDEANHHAMDYDFWVRLALSGARFRFLDRTVSVALLHEDAKSVASRTKQLDETIATCAKHYGFAHPRWITAFARSKVLGDTSFLDQSASNVDALAREEIDAIECKYFLRYNASPSAMAALSQNDPETAVQYIRRHQGRASTNLSSNQTLRPPQTCDLAFYPEFRDLGALKMQIRRLQWYVPASSGLVVRLFVTENLRREIQASQSECTIPQNVSIAQCPDGSEMDRMLGTSRSVAVWQDFGRYSPHPKSLPDVRVFNLDKHHQNRREAFQSSVLLHELDWPQRKKLSKSNAKKAQKILKRHEKQQRAYLFCTGPSVSQALGHDFSNGYRIVCNSIVTNHELMELIKPQFIVAADPVFHFGSSDYSYAFRDKLQLAVERFNSTVLVPFFYYPLLAQNCPQLAEHTIAVGQDPNLNFNLDLRKGLVVRGSDNILTLIMIPLAATLANELFVLGCDGRKPDENYFWKHDPSSQFGHLMQSAKDHHPSFFDHVDYSDYYDKHCDNLANMIESLEVNGQHLQTITSSYIPCLSARSADINQVTQSQTGTRQISRTRRDN